MSDNQDLTALTATLRALEESILDPAVRSDPARILLVKPGTIA